MQFYKKNLHNYTVKKYKNVTTFMQISIIKLAVKTAKNVSMWTL